MADITLTSASRSNLLSLQNTQDMVNRTQNRLSTGKSVNSVIDDALKYFQSKSLSDRAADLSARKDSIGQGVNALKTVVETTDKLEKLVNQMKGILNSARSATKVQRGEFSDQLRTLAVQMEKLVQDTSYNGLNLLNSSASSLTVYFSEKSDSKLKVDGVDLTINQLFQKTDGSGPHNASSIATSTGSALLTGTLNLTQMLSQYSLSQASILASFNERLDLAAVRLDKTIENVRAKAASFGNSVAILQVRLDFTENYTNILNEGADKLTLADLNEEGANLLALQTRQQLGVQALSFAGQSEQAVLGLFR